jgi:protein TonB
MSEIAEPAAVRLPVLDRPWHRLPFVVGASLVLWAGVMVLFGFFLQLTRLPPPSPEPLEASLIEVPVNGLAGGGGGSVGAGQVSPARRIANPAPVAKTKPKALHAARPHPDKAMTNDVPPSHDLAKRDPVPPFKNADSVKVSSKTVAESSLTPTQSSGAAAAGEGGVGNGTGTGAGNGVGGGLGTGAGGGVGSGGNGPEAIYAPVPSIPNDMRDEVLEAEAIARFRVSHDGNATVSLAKPTDFSRLNDIILETLRTWRFHPASRNGVAIDSDAEVRLLITVQ